jgi:hypothetical protein
MKILKIKRIFRIHLIKGYTPVNKFTISQELITSLAEGMKRCRVAIGFVLTTN